MEDADRSTKILINLGLTATQAKIYLALSKMGKTTAETISKNAGITRPDAYRVLNELQEKGLITTEIAAPRQYQAVAVTQVTTILLNQKLEEYKQAVQETEELIQNIKDTDPQPQNEKHRILIINGTKSLMQLIRKEHGKARHSIYIIAPYQRWTQIAGEIHEHYEQALERGVQYRIILEKTEPPTQLPETLNVLFTKPNFQIRISSKPLEVNAAVFDDETAAFNSCPTMPLGKSPMIWTNHPSFLKMCKDHFETQWKTAKPIGYKTMKALRKKS